MSNTQLVSEHRTQVYFPRDLYRAVKERAKKEEKSIAKIIRRAVEKEVLMERKSNQKKRDKVWKEFLSLSGIGSGPSDLSENHDSYIDPEYKPETISKK